MRVGVVGGPLPLSRPTVRRIVGAVLDGERAGPATVSVTFLPGRQMRALNRRALHRDYSTDVIAFRLEHAGTVAGDVYVCPAAARAAARREGIPIREELVRLVIHGMLHVLGQDHPRGRARLRSPMWNRQEGYVARLGGAAP